MGELTQATTAAGLQHGLAGGVFTNACFSTLVHLGREHGPLGRHQQAPSVFPIDRYWRIASSPRPFAPPRKLPWPSSLVLTLLPITPHLADAASPSVVGRLMGLEF